MSTRLFLAIPYAPSFAWVRDAIAAACQAHEVELRSVDETTRPGGEIVRAIHEEIDEADLGVAVLSGLNPNVFYELGRLHQASKPTAIRREAERRMGKSGCTTDDIQSHDGPGFKGWHQKVCCPDGDDLRIVIDLNGEIKRVRRI